MASALGLGAMGQLANEPWIVANLNEKQISKMPANYYELKIATEALKREIEEMEDSATSQRREVQDKEREVHRRLDKLHADEGRVK